MFIAIRKQVATKLLLADYKCYALRIGFWGTLGISSGRRVTVFDSVGHRAPPNEDARLNRMAEKTIIFVSLSCGGFSGFPVVFTVSIIMNRLRYIIESCQSFQTVLLSGLRNIPFASDSSHCRSSLERRQSHVMSMATITIDYYKAFGLTNLPSLGLPALIRSPLTRAFPSHWERLVIVTNATLLLRMSLPKLLVKCLCWKSSNPGM